LLRDGAGYGLPAAEGELAKEASVAEALVTTYTEAKRDPLTELDIRLPEELRQRVEKLDRELLANKDDTEVQQH